MRRRARPPLESTDFAAAARRVLADYEGFVAASAEAGDAADARAFAARHAAARAALAHLEQLLKLAGDGGREEEVQDIAHCLGETRRQIAALAEEESADDEGG
jgi:hypothetical protein